MRNRFIKVLVTVAIYVVAPGICPVHGGLAWAAGTTAGREINNVAVADFQIGGAPQTPVSSNAVQIFVDEMLDASVVSDDAGPVGVSSPDSGAVLQFTVTNTGNGSESFRLVPDASLAGDDFDPSIAQIYLESNGIPGLQTGGGGDTVYVAGGNDPTLLADAFIVVFLSNTVPGALADGAQGRVALRAVATTIFVQAGTDDPSNPSWPAVGTSYPGAGDLDELGGGNVTAVVGTSHDTSSLAIQSEGVLQVSAAVVGLTKTAASFLDPFGGTTLVPGTVIRYDITVNVGGSGTAQNLVVSDVIPADLQYVAGTLSVSFLPAGEEADDDFAPVGTDNTGFNSGLSTVIVNLADVAGGGPAITISFEATIR